MFKLAFRRIPTIAYRAPLVQNVHATPVRTFFGGSKDAANNETVEKFATALQENPRLGELLTGFSTMLADKGIPVGKPPSMIQMMSILKDKDIRDHLVELQKELVRADIKITQADLSALTDMFTKQMQGKQ